MSNQADALAPILARTILTPRAFELLAARKAELEPAVSCIVDSLLIFADNDEELAIGLGLMALELLVQISKANPYAKQR